MASLTQTAITARKIIRYSIFAVIALIIARITFSTGVRVYRYFYPEPPPAPTVAFGKLPKLPFPDNKLAGNPSFTLETPEGTLPVLPTQGKVYFMPKPIQTQLNLELARDKADNLGFNPAGEQITESLYQFPHQKVHATLEMNIINGLFSIGYDLSKDSTPLDNRPPAPEIAAAQVRSILSSANLLPEDLSGPVTHQFLKIEEGSFNNALSLSEADLVKVHLFRKDYDDLPSLTSNPNEANTWFIVSGSRERAKQIIATEFHYFPIDEDESATYPLKLAETAWEELKNGNAFIAAQGVDNESNIIIRRVYLAYYDPGVQTGFYQPIIVFEGDRGFVAYVSAIAADYYGE